MDQMISLSKEDIRNAIKEIRSLLNSASHYFLQGKSWDRDIFNEPHFLSEAYIKEAFVQMMVFSETLGLIKGHDQIEAMFEEAKTNFLKEGRGIEESYLVWAADLEDYLNGIATAHNINFRGSGGALDDIAAIIKACQYTITDEKVFGTAPLCENDVHLRIESILKPFFPNLLHKPSLTKEIKGFVPDTGLPEIQTLIEYKFISTEADAKSIVDEILADTRGYFSREWTKFVYVIYETARIKPEDDWNNLFRSCGIDHNSRAIVLAGVPSTQKN
jgi:hypothetical protein